MVGTNCAQLNLNANLVLNHSLTLDVWFARREKLKLIHSKSSCRRRYR